MAQTRRPLYLRGVSYWRGSRTPMVVDSDVITTEDGLPIGNEIEQALLVES